MLTHTLDKAMRVAVGASLAAHHHQVLLVLAKPDLAPFSTKERFFHLTTANDGSGSPLLPDLPIGQAPR